MNKPHKYAEVIKAWADGAEVEFKPPYTSSWWPTTTPTWDSYYEYRIGVKEEVLITRVTLHKGSLTYPYLSTNSDPTYGQKNLKLTFTDGKLTAAEVIK
mgnify:FL=1